VKCAVQNLQLLVGQAPGLYIVCVSSFVVKIESAFLKKTRANNNKVSFCKTKRRNCPSSFGGISELGEKGKKLKKER
jgi:hypothetical protein